MKLPKLRSYKTYMAHKFITAYYQSFLSAVLPSGKMFLYVGIEKIKINATFTLCTTVFWYVLHRVSVVSGRGSAGEEKIQMHVYRRNLF